MNINYTLLSIINKFETVPGKKALHKITYFTNLQTQDFIFRWNNFGPYSDDVQQFFEDAYLDEIISVDEQQLNQSAIQYNTKLTDEGIGVLKQIPKNDIIDNAINSSYDLLNGKSPRQMEILASVHYIINYDCTFNPEKIFKILDRLKPDSHFKLEEVKEALSILQQVKLA